MNIPNLGINNSRTAIILGAGATRSASCFEGKNLTAPLDADFFKICQALMHFEPKLKPLIDFVREEFSNTLNYRMEHVFTSVEALDLFFRSIRVSTGPTVKKYEKILNDYSTYLALVFATLRTKHKLSELTCKYHDSLVNTLDANDTIISFNYDTIIDTSLKTIAKKKWNPRKGYGFDITNGANDWTDHSGKGKVAKEGISLLKLHGSLNWKRAANGNISLRKDSYEISGRTKNEIVPPVWNKRLSDDDVLVGVWKNARLNLRAVRSLVIIGYSLPTTDVLTNSLLKVSLAENVEQLENIIVVNPDVSVHDKIIALASAKIQASTQFVHYNSLHELNSSALFL